MVLKYSIYLLLLMSLSSCYYTKKMVYLQDKDFSENQARLIQNKKGQYRIQPNDVLSVKVKSATDVDISDIFNITPAPGSMYLSPGNLYMEGYSVDEKGQITLPILGSIIVKDLTLEEVQQTIQNNAKKYLNNATVIVKLVSFKITVLGEVKNPGYHYVFNNQATLLEGLGLAGDLTQYGNRENIKLIRQQEKESKVILLDLTDSDLLKSEYYYLMPNDVLYVEPFQANTKRVNLDLLGLVFSAITTAILILNYIESN